MLRELTDIKSDMLVICPDVVTNCALHDLVDLHRLRGASATCLVTAKMEPEEGAAKKPKGEDTEKDVMGLDSSTRWGTVFDPDEAQQRLLYLASADEMSEGISLHSSLLRRCPSIKMHTNLVDSTIYVLAPWVIDVLQPGQAGADYSSVKDELVPFLVRHQHRSNSKRIPEAAMAARQEHLEVHNMTTTLPAMTTTQVDFTEDLVQCYALVPNTGIDGTPVFCMKAGSVSSYLELNREITNRRIHAPGPLWEGVKDAEYPHRSERKKFDADSIIGDGSTFGEKTTVKRTTLGKACEVGNSVKIAMCVIMDNVKIGDNVKLEGCVICSGAEIPAGVNLAGCKVGYNHKVPADVGSCKNETLCDEQEFQDGEEWEY